MTNAENTEVKALSVAQSRPVEIEEFIPSDTIRTALAYQQATGLPKEAVPAIVAAANAHFGLKKLIRHQLRLHPEKKKAFIVVPKGRVLTDSKLKECEEFSRLNQVPLSSLYVTDTGAVTIRATGWRYKVQGDPRCFKGFENTKIEKTVEEGITTFTVEGDLVFWSGDRYHCMGAASSDEPRAGRTAVAFLKMIAETRFQSRGMRLALGLPFETAEDVIVGEEVMSAPSPEPGGKIKGTADFLARAQAEKGLRRADILKQLGLTSLSEIADLEEAYGRLEEAK